MTAFVDSGVITSVATPVNSSAGSNVSTSGSTHNENLNPIGTPTTTDFECGTTSACGHGIGPRNRGSGTRAVALNTDFTALQQNTIDHLRLVSIAGGFITGHEIQTFTTRVATPAMPSSPLVLLPATVPGCGTLALNRRDLTALA